MVPLCWMSVPVVTPCNVKDRPRGTPAYLLSSSGKGINPSFGESAAQLQHAHPAEQKRQPIPSCVRPSAKDAEPFFLTRRQHPVGIEYQFPHQRRLARQTL